MKLFFPKPNDIKTFSVKRCIRYIRISSIHSRIGDVSQALNVKVILYFFGRQVNQLVRSKYVCALAAFQLFLS